MLFSFRSYPQQRLYFSQEIAATVFTSSCTVPHQVGLRHQQRLTTAVLHGEMATAVVCGGTHKCQYSQSLLSPCVNTIAACLEALLSIRQMIQELQWPDKDVGCHLEQRYLNICSEQLQYCTNM